SCSSLRDAARCTLSPYTTLFRSFRFEPGADGTFDHQRIMLALADFQPIETERLVLRPYRMTDAPRIQELAGHRDVAKTVSALPQDRKSTRLNSSHVKISYAVFCL